MAIPNLKTQVKQNLKTDIANEEKKGNDARFLNFFDMKKGEKMTILFVPDENGQFWVKYSKHGPNLRVKNAKGQDVGVRGVGSVNCSYKSSGEDCPACQKGFDYFSEAKETSVDDLKEEGKKWMPKDYVLTSCIVLDSPIDVADDEKGNQVKLFNLPYAVENIIKEAITEGQVPEDELCSTPFVIKKTENKGGRPSYENSYFAREQITDDDLSFLEDMVVEQYDYDDLDVVPAPTTTDEVQEWLDKAEEKYEEALKKKSSSSSDEDNGDDSGDDPVKNKQESRLSRFSGKNGDKEEAEGDSQEEENTETEESEEEGQTSDDSEGDEGDKAEDSGDVRSRLNRLKTRKD